MPAVQGGIRFDDVVRRWHALAERRVVYYQELYHSGRWTHYFRTRQDFAARMLDVIKAAKTLAAQCGRQAPPEPAREDLRSAA